MSRSAADATRFTATGPYASSKPSTSPYKLPGFMQGSNSKTHSSGNGSGNGNGNGNGSGNGSGNGNKQETPRERVDRLRAQARAARIAQSSSKTDSMVEFGRRFANKAHKTAVYTLITASGMFLSEIRIRRFTGG